MKIIYLVCFLLLIFLLNTAYAADSVDIRSSLISDASLADYQFTSSSSGNDSWTISPMNWGAFYYKINNNEFTETMYIYPYNETGPMSFTGNKADSIPHKIDIYYETVPLTLKYSYKGWNYGTVGGESQYGVYTIINLFGDTYVAIAPENYILNPDTPIPPVYKYTASSDKLAKLVINDDEVYQLRTGEELPLGSGYILVPAQIDVNGKKAQLNLFKDGELIGSSIVNTDSGSTDSQADTMILKQTVLNESDILMFRARAAQVFQGTSDSIVEIEGLWLIDPDSAFIVDPDESFGEFEPDVISSNLLRYKVDKLPFVEDKTTSLGKDISLETLEFDSSITEWGFFLIKEHSVPKKYEIRSHILTAANQGAGIRPQDFAGFYIDGYSGTEEMNFEYPVDDSNRTIAKGNLTYNSTPVKSGYGGRLSGDYYLVGLFGTEYVSFSATDSNKIMELVMDSGTKRTLATGQEFKIGSGYTLVPNQIDVNGKKAYMELFKDGESIGSSIVDTDKTAAEKTWTLNRTVLNEETTVAKVYVDTVFQGTNDSLLEIRGIWMADYTTAREIKTDDDFGKLEYVGLEYVQASGVNKLLFKSNENLTLEKDKTVVLTDDFSFKIANNNTLRFYLFTTNEVKSETSAETPENEIVEENTPSNQTPSATQPTSPVSSMGSSNSSGTSSSDGISSYGIWIVAGIALIILCTAVGYVWMKNKNK